MGLVLPSEEGLELNAWTGGAALSRRQPKPLGLLHTEAQQSRTWACGADEGLLKGGQGDGWLMLPTCLEPPNPNRKALLKAEGGRNTVT